MIDPAGRAAAATVHRLHTDRHRAADTARPAPNDQVARSLVPVNSVRAHLPDNTRTITPRERRR